MKQSTSQQPKISPMVLAIIGTPKERITRPDFLDTVADVAVDTLTAATRFSGKLTVAFDTVNFHDGRKVQKLRGYHTRSNFWQGVGVQYGLTDNDLAAIIAS